MMASLSQPLIFERLMFRRSPSSTRLPVNLGSMKMARAMAMITRISVMVSAKDHFVLKVTFGGVKEV